MADVEVTYNNNTIVELSESGTKTLKTAGKYCEDDIVLEYVKPAGSGSAAEDYTVFLFPLQYSIECAAGSGTCSANGSLHWVNWEAASGDGVPFYQNVHDWTGLETIQYSNYCNKITVTTDTDIGTTWSLEFFADWHRTNDNAILTVSFAGFTLKRKKTTLSSFTVNSFSVSLSSHTYSPQSHMAFVYNNGVLRIFENGELIDAKTVTLAENPKSLQITNNYVSAEYIGQIVLSNLRLASIALGTESSYPVPTQLYLGDELVDLDIAEIDPTEAINFYDYDGTLVTRWPLSKLQSKTALPEGPTHDGLTFQGWNWSLSDLKSVDHAMNVGALYIPADEKTHIFITVPDKYTKSFSLIIQQTPTNSTTIAWGDGSSETVSGTGTKTISHTYSTTGDYEITLTIASGATVKLGGATAGTSSALPDNIIRKVYIGPDISISNYAFKNKTLLNEITIPRGITSIPEQAFYNCYQLKCLILPDGLTSIGSNVFSYNVAMSIVSFPNSLVSIGASAFASSAIMYAFFGNSLTTINSNSFNGAIALEHSIISSGVTTLDNSTFNGCKNLKTLDILGQTTTFGGAQYCYLLKNLSLSSSVTTFSTYALANCGLEILVLDSNITTLNSYAIADCLGLTHIYFKGTTPPQAKSSYVFNNLPKTCVIHVPTGYLSAYTSASNYPSSSNYVYVEESYT